MSILKTRQSVDFPYNYAAVRKCSSMLLQENINLKPGMKYTCSLKQAMHCCFASDSWFYIQTSVRSGSKLDVVYVLWLCCGW
jgi:hypothetical protein